MWTIVFKVHWATDVSLIQSERHQQSPKKTKGDGEHQMRELLTLILLSIFTNAIEFKD